MKDKTLDILTQLKVFRFLHYEREMFYATATDLSSQKPGKEKYPQHVVNALVESFVIHTRVLIEFFYPSESVHSDTILARHFFSPNKNWTRHCPKKSKLVRDTKERADNLLAHLTYTRSEGKLNKKWPVAEIVREIGATLKIFGEIPEIVALCEQAENMNFKFEQPMKSKDEAKNGAPDTKSGS
jgi:hypothetical protein